MHKHVAHVRCINILILAKNLLIVLWTNQRDMTQARGSNQKIQKKIMHFCFYLCSLGRDWQVIYVCASLEFQFISQFPFRIRKIFSKLSKFSGQIKMENYDVRTRSFVNI